MGNRQNCMRPLRQVKKQYEKMEFWNWGPLQLGTTFRVPILFQIHSTLVGRWVDLSAFQDKILFQFPREIRTSGSH